MTSEEEIVFSITLKDIIKLSNDKESSPLSWEEMDSITREKLIPTIKAALYEMNRGVNHKSFLAGSKERQQYDCMSWEEVVIDCIEHLHNPSKNIDFYKLMSKMEED